MDWPSAFATVGVAWAIAWVCVEIFRLIESVAKDV